MAKEQFEGITVDGKPLEIFIQEEHRDEIIDAANREVYDKSAGIHVPIITKHTKNFSGARSERRDFASSTVSDEVKQTLTHITKYKGEKAMHDYINANGTENGPLEKALLELKSNLNDLKSERARVNVEINRLEAAISSTETAKRIMLGKEVIAASIGHTVRQPRTGERRKHGHWPSRAKEILSNGAISKRDLSKVLRAEGSGHALVYNLIHAGHLEERNGLMYWMEIQAEEAS